MNSRRFRKRLNACDPERLPPVIKSPHKAENLQSCQQVRITKNKVFLIEINLRGD